MICPISEEDDWNDVIKECSSLAAKWEQLSGFLGLRIETIDTIKENFPNNAMGCWNEALKQWIKQNYRTARYGYPSWRMLLEAIARIDKLLFQKLADKHQGMSRASHLILMTLYHKIMLRTPRQQRTRSQ